MVAIAAERVLRQMQRAGFVVLKRRPIGRRGVGSSVE
jgi:hypothetical protein